jgi:hypothetical protein
MHFCCEVSILLIDGVFEREGLIRPLPRHLARNSTAFTAQSFRSCCGFSTRCHFRYIVATVRVTHAAPKQQIAAPRNGKKTS